ncbi:MAG: hypothetical protein L6420_02245 [Elusimicrobia bacterium]|nr:hypothetical protein [Elusimicrobiota bacterium]
MRGIILATAMFFSISAANSAGNNFSLNSMPLSELGNMNNEIAIEEVSPSAPAYNFGQTKIPVIGPILDLTLKLPFKAFNERLGEIEGLTVLEKKAPVLAKEGDNIIFANAAINVNGIEAEPVIRIKPWFEGKNRLALKFVKIDIDTVFGPKSRTLPVINKDEVMNLAVKKITDALLANMGAALALNRVNTKAEDLITFNYDKLSWTLRCDISPKFISPLMPNLLNSIHFTSFSFDESGFAISVHSGADIKQLEGYNLALSDGLITNFIKEFVDSKNFDLSSGGHDGGIKFKADGKMELAAMTKVDALPFNPNVYFTVTINPKVVAANTLRIVFDDIAVNQAYGIGIPGFINSMIKRKIIESAVKSIAENPELAKVMKAKKINDKTVELKFENRAFLPSFVKGVNINKMKIDRGLMYIDFEL